MLLTDQKLRAALHNPNGLLDLVGSSTSALDQTRRLELLKGADVSFRGTKSFSDKLNAVVLQLDLSERILYGGYVTIWAKVLSCTGSISKKNTTDIENDLVHSSTS